MRRLRIAVVAAASTLISSGAFAQGTLSTQGFGYPPGQLSARALGTGGGLAEFDFDTPINPSAIGLSGEMRLYLQYEPELRKLSNGSAASTTTTSRFPLISLLVPAGAHATFGLSASTFLDRSSTTKITRTLDVAGESVEITETNRVLGSINDIRLAGAYSANEKFQAGVAGHVFTGQNKNFFSQTFPDTLKFTPISQTTTLGFTGYGVSGGILVRPSRIIGLGLSGMKGMTIRSRAGDTLVSEADIPDRISAGVSYEGIPGSSISAHLARETWSKLNGLASPTGGKAADAWDGGLGVEAIGPRLSDRTTIIRLGARYRTLPFLAAGDKVKELSFAAGLGAQFFRNRAAFDVTLQRAMRSADASSLSGIKERSYIFSFGLRVRP
ncbi:MAG TPA: hypothetical protein VM053_04095 [Gemmatimonadaceae bacterium]|nr:hypothetical protein [Gemmatimonadaceae bacterium]